MSRSHSTTALAGVVLLAALSGCSSSSEAAPPIVRSATPSISSSPSATPSPTATAPPTPEEQATSQAQQAVRSYYEVTDRLGADATPDLEALRTVSTGTALNDARNQLISHQTQGWKQIGGTRVVAMTPTSISLVNKPSQQPPQVPTVKIDVCYDVSGLNVVDASGKSVVAARRQDKALAEMGVSNYAWPSAQGWKVAYTVITEKPCGAV